ncbi:hypothetical protein KBTX_02685 [wastewater metagenome]|uniref:DUF1461 domain-containing protein n=2 Tax=unclassified sequences TaxID=12908 RepID=A0A5B8RE29_9ZZZZ|nr:MULTISPECIES: hypothetical protein [Arhodomonas]MCS4503441.1 hypothetical protein [Arhodomonas aquaeolei]QEA06353.1 hypothetical protein KBTEX_02685 [uncultured organism]
MTGPAIPHTLSPARLTTRLAGILLAPLLLVACAGAAWQVLSTADFGYPVLYRWLDIQAHIAEYGPQNRYRNGFETLTPETHQALFGAILDAVNHGGKGLGRIRYRPAGSARSIPMLRAPEIAHLRLVAAGVQRFLQVAVAAAILAAAATLWLAAAGHVPPARTLLLSLAVGLALVAAATAAMFDAGGGGWFSRLHEWVFPAGHQWFFYYQESLMTTLMKAPAIFGPMAAALAAVTTVLTGLVLAAVVATLSLVQAIHRR